ncbi:TAXI family TRAP transporter solute-binding subunit [Undibacterium macrobrachii]|uniref:C4-dicarboxylate ABC transporter substrate-binding protein n=1 Tax=Undibacterium macrobrachii TaxID=1119058 RepID=A0ABQ2X8S8_9BURK|nr:TAXI family TRAP transporter solute-binding subunit [Undibacterium macrobrachii]GGX04637.1 C4-dicarboxylate ABC transporter substrate-binding protein [Undibacterium macrobrachii]
MPKIKFTLISTKDALIAFGPIALMIIAVILAAYYVVDPAPGRTLDFSAGQENSAYERFAKQYAEELAQNQITLRIHKSQGSQENLQHIADLDSKIDIGFVQSGSTTEKDAQEKGLISLGSLFYEPIWIFYRGKKEVTSLTEFKAKRVNVGPDGFGVRRLFQQLLSVNNLDENQLEIHQLESTPATVAFVNEQIDVLVMSSASDSQLIQMLLQTPGVKLFDFVQAEAYTRRFPFLSHVVLPRGIVDMGRDIPSRDYHLISPTATLVAHESLHPALISLFLQAAKKIHGGANWFSKQGEFPSDRYTEITVEPQAEKFYKSGPPFLQRYLSFWMSNFLERMWVLFIAFGALALPLSKIIPPLYVWRVRSRIYRWYGQLRAVEHALDEASPEQKQQIAQQQLQRLNEIENKVNHISIPLAYAEELYGLRSHIQFVRKRVQNGV